MKMRLFHCGVRPAWFRARTIAGRLFFVAVYFIMQVRH